MDSSDHRAIGNRLDLFHQQEDGPGVVFWHPRGATLYRLLENHVHRRMREAGFSEIITPQLLSRSLWERSGHWDKFGDAMFTLEDGERAFALKPMSCPGHVQVFRKRVRSYRDLPLRYFEFGACHRNEPSGALQGLMRTRAFVQDDAHIFCREDQIEDEVARFCNLLRIIYGELGFPDFIVGFSTRPAKRAGSDDVWDKAEAVLEHAARAAGFAPRLQPGEGAFYGPKLEFILRDGRGREWQCGTIQLDFVLPERLEAEYVASDGRRVQATMIHHAVFGSMERFIAMLLEHYGGQLPFWLAPDQVVVAPISQDQAGYARRVADALARNGLRARLDDASESLSRRIVQAREDGIPVFLAVGEREERDGTVSVRRRDGRPVVLSMNEAILRFREENSLGAFQSSCQPRPG